MKIIACDLKQGIQYSNPFKEQKIYPFDKIGRCVVNKDTGEIKRWCGEENSNFDTEGNPINFDEKTEEIMVYFPAFYYKRSWEGTQVTDEILDMIPQQTEIQGYKVHPAFLRKDGSFRPYVLVGAFAGCAIDNQLRSVIKKPVSYSLSDARSKSKYNRNEGFGLMNIAIFSMVQLLYKIGFQDLNASIKIGFSTVEYSGALPETMELGNRTGKGAKRESDNYYFNNTSLFGIELFYASFGQALDGVKIKNNELYVTNFVEDFTNIDNYTKLDIALPTQNGLIKNIHEISGEFDYLNIPKEIIPEGDTNQYYTDFFQKSEDNESLLKYGFVGTPSAKNGVFSINLSSSSSDLGVFRLVYLP